ncbi:sorbitol dehydrogenase [Scheffersomyces stipitis CBS 6054]|uniref:Sorbitol dehydrogenase n=1 Tax=Scheffersomyces stipitis (strain ATCC 58785 / CBS 6054 / NBRC 10063 / NRRL Y-11545) TaxID=322104 RepID=A3LVP0_PICST|nr:sorbitol dehydrogenase [Scheffersomyces stipitis CBS 6054]ABN67155.2 sorbitol dehydrogenase [Scheffersomyces stipitis CBS 6054]
MSIPETMKAIVFHGPGDIRTETRPTPVIEEPSDVILKVKFSGLCGTDLHSYRGHIKGPIGTIIGHEFVGEVVARGADISDSVFTIGEDVLSTFTIQCGQCWYCKHGYSGQCDVTNTFGKVGLNGGQSEYVRVPFAKSTLVKKPQNNDGIDDSVYVLMADIFITGYYGVKKIRDFLSTKPAVGIEAQEFKDVTILQLGVGPVGLCALRVLKHFGFTKVVCVDSVPSRLEEAKRLGAYKAINFETDKTSLEEFIRNETGNVGFDAVLEVVGASSAVKTAYDSVRRNGFISSLGMGHEPLPFNGLDCYLKNINISFGRCHCWSLFPEALEVFESMKADFASFIDYTTGLDGAKEAFELFDKHKVNKVVFDLTK